MKRWVWSAAAAAALLPAALALLLQSDWFRAKLQQQAVHAVQSATGSRATLERIDIDWVSLTVRLEGFSLDGARRPGEQPLFEAARITARLAIRPFSSRRLSLRELRLENPRIHLYHREDGSSNLPQPPGPRRDATPVEDLVRLRAGLLDFTNARLELNDRQHDFNLRLENFDLDLAYDFRSPRYRVRLSARRAALPWRLAPSLELQAWLAADSLEIVSARAQIGDSSATFRGSVIRFRRPEIDIDYRASVLLRDLEASPVRQGFAVSSGKVRLRPGGPLRVEGSLRAEQLALAGKGFHVRRLDARGRFTLTPDSLRIEPLEIDSPYMAWRGALHLKDWRELALEGEASEASLARLQAVLRQPPTSLDARLAGPVGLSMTVTPAGPRGAEIRGALEAQPAEGAIPLEGRVRFAWRQACGCAEFGDSWIATRSIRAAFRGTLGDSLEAGIHANSLEEVPAILAAAGAPGGLPPAAALDHGVASAALRLDGPFEALRISGSVSASRLLYEGIPLERVQAKFSATAQRLEVESFMLRQSAGLVEGTVSLGLKDWKPHAGSALRASLKVERADLERLLRLAGIHAGIRGLTAGSVHVEGTVARPHGSLRLAVEGAAWRQEALGRVMLEGALEETGKFRLLASRGGARLETRGSWIHEPGNAGRGAIRASAHLDGFSTSEFTFFRGLPLPFEATLEARGELALETGAGTPRLTALGGWVSGGRWRLGSVEFDGLRVDAETRNGTLALRARIQTKPAPVEAAASIQLQGDWPAEFRLRWPGLSVSRLHRWLADSGRISGDPLPVSGAFDADIDGRLRLAPPGGLSGRIVIPRLELRPAPEEAQAERLLPQELFLRNSGPLIFDFDERAVRVRQAQLAALDTDLTLSGAYDFAAPLPWNLEARGTANLAVLGSFYPALTAGGTGRLRVVLRGAPSEPQVSGQMEIVKGSFYLKELPVGLDDVHGVIYFDRNRANIQKLTGVSGGGTAALSGFVGLARGDLTLRLQAQLANVRVRYPEGISNTVDADLVLTGSRSASLLSGLVTVKRSGLVITGNAGAMLGDAGGPFPSAAAQNDFLRNLQFDVRLRSAPDAVFITSYTSDLQLEADLRLRGSPAKPILLGSLFAHQGEVNFLGNRYNISRGEILFYNTGAMIPQIDLDLETRVRGITVYLNVSGPLSRLNITYRSEPPLQSSEILALLTVGRTPAATSGSVVATDRIRSQTVMENSAGTNTLLGTALTAGLSSRTERFFGASRLRIDPSNVGVDALPQARLSIEQSIARDVTITFITNLNRSQQQVVRLEWDLSRQWSVIAIKDENGAFAVDFLYRKRFR
ncbi:MAG: translocation/assembly module TamB domain-containing protein [Bryobacteraceae bacterium]